MSDERNSRLKSELHDYAMITLGIALYTVGFTVFIIPHHIVIGGMTGFATLVFYASGETIPISVTIYGMNLLLLLLGGRVLGKGFVLRSIFGATVLSLMIGLVEGYFTTHPPIVANTPVSLALGSVFLGIGIGTYYVHHGTSGGTDIVAAIMAKMTTASMGRVLLIVDASIVALSFFLPFDGDMEARVQVRTESIIYGWLAIFIYSTLAGKYESAGRQTVQFFIVSERWQEIAERITHETGRGITYWEAKGYWTGKARILMMMMCRKEDTGRMYGIIYDLDPGAFISTSYAHNIYGNGFDRLQVARRKDKKI